MSTPSSPPVSVAYVPYQAYKSKRHSHTLSSSTAHLTPNQSPPPVSRPPSSAVDTLTLPPKLVLDGESEQIHESTRHVSPTSLLVPQQTHNSHTISTQHGLESVSSLSSGFLSSNPTEPQTSVELQATPQSKVVVAHQAPKISTPSPGPSNSQSVPKKGSTFRRVQPKSTRPKLSATHSRESSSSSPAPVLHKVQGNADNRPPAPAPTTSLPVISTPTALIHPLPSISPPPIAERSTSLVSQQSYTSFGQASSQDRSAILRTTSTSTAPDNEGLILNISGNSSPLPTRKPAPYRPGFQPKGVYRPLTDEFLAIRRTLHEGDGEGGMKRVERTKLERRLEKLIDLHFPRHTFEDGTKESLQPDKRPVLRSSKEARRASSFFDFQTLRNLNINDAGDLWRGVVSGSLGDPVRNDIRAAEQRITPWQDDAAVSKCPLCSALFHALTNRKHHCRLCGQIVCSLPIKLHQRKVLCSSLFVVDSETHQIEEVGEGVDYGVRRRRTDSISGNQGRQIEEDKFLKGVRICRECRPVLLKQQYYQQTRITPPFALLYTDFIRLESAIEESLPKFQELIMSLNHHDQPTKEASAARKRLLDSFAQYDKLSKKIRGLPCPNGPGSSQDRVQAAILTRANLFLQKNMFPLQSLPTPHSGKGAGTPNSQNDGVMNTPSTMSADVDAALAQKLQPLLEQEALLESFVEEAQTQRKFEDVKTLKVNLLEIRQEIERLLQAVPKGSRNSLSEVK
ncbi:Rabenosyn-5 [Psilocybe cubensis]|uniref:FYVE-type domain-containing protein n=2 Tax=Psilocybe cubensis TaxID=181762 RepID=A0A8H8CNY1_PSICU|nr:Rabenosyn-5 [Psilocybe cubensis]KAH9484129.1 Rabenosyn-5 [Psilocybe cubensis]